MELSDLCGSCFGSRGDGPFCIHCGFREGDPAENPLHLKPGTVLKDQYIIGRVLGCGGFGVTYLAYDMNLHMVKAIKEYLPSSLATRGADGVSVCAFTGQSAEHYAYGLKEFIREGRILAMFAGVSSVVSVYDYFAENNTAYLVMEYLKGKDLAAYLNQRGGRIPWDEIQPIFAPVMQVLQQVHAAGLIHRDISPDNIYLTDDGQVKLIDFGAARQAIGERSQSLTVILKQGYAPPEQYQSNGNQGPWTDVYAMGDDHIPVPDGRHTHGVHDARDAGRLKAGFAAGCGAAPERGNRVVAEPQSGPAEPLFQHGGFFRKPASRHPGAEGANARRPDRRRRKLCPKSEVQYI